MKEKNISKSTETGSFALEHQLSSLITNSTWICIWALTRTHLDT